MDAHACSVGTAEPEWVPMHAVWGNQGLNAGDAAGGSLGGHPGACKCLARKGTGGRLSARARTAGALRAWRHAMQAASAPMHPHHGSTSALSTCLLVRSSQALADHLALQRAALLRRDADVEILCQPCLALLVHEQHELDGHGAGRPQLPCPAPISRAAQQPASHASTRQVKATVYNCRAHRRVFFPARGTGRRGAGFCAAGCACRGGGCAAGVEKLDLLMPVDGRGRRCSPPAPSFGRPKTSITPPAPS
eukprot:207662-Chlamydomonas_euryale.AAC.2